MSETDDGLFVYPPTESATGRWFVRSVGGTHDPNPVMADGDSKRDALRLARGLRDNPTLR